MNIPNINDLSLDSLQDVVKMAQAEAEKMLSTLSVEDRAKVNNIVSSVDKDNTESISKKIAELKAEINTQKED